MKLLAALIFFTRIPFRRIKNIPAEAFRDMIACWPLVGWLTGGLTAAVLWIGSLLLPGV
jgi:adenosylcobinamide-GDP ribazoletransferase